MNLRGAELPFVRRAVLAGVALAAVVMTGACSHQQMYDAMRVNQQNECLKLPREAYERCMEEMNRPYGQYEAQRQEAIKGNDQ